MEQVLCLDGSLMACSCSAAWLSMEPFIAPQGILRKAKIDLIPPLPQAPKSFPSDYYVVGSLPYDSRSIILMKHDRSVTT